MALVFETIDDTKYDLIEEISLRSKIQMAGRKKVVFVEGYHDEKIYKIILSDYEENLFFIDVSLTEAKATDKSISAQGGCERVKEILSYCVLNISKEKRFYGIIDRDLKMDFAVSYIESLTNFDGRLFIFKERYTLENYFITFDVLFEFINRQTINHHALIPLSTRKDDFETILRDIENNLAVIGAANLTIRFFNKEESFLEPSISLKDIESRVLQKLKNVSKDEVISKFEEFKSFVESTRDNVHKFASGKVYGSYNFKINIERQCKVSLQLNNCKSELASILKEKGLPNDFRELIKVLGCC